jgi:hypothetical protein
MKTQNLLGINSSDVPIGNLLWVDAINGIDALAVRGRMTIPFKTLTAAKNTAVSGDTVVVLPGTYNEKNLLKNGVNWHFLSGAKVAYSGAEDGGIFDTSTFGTNGPVSCSITGDGEFSITSVTGSRNVIHSAASGSDLLIQGCSMQAADICIKIGSSVTSGLVAVDVTKSIKSTSAPAVSINGTVSSYRIRADEIYGDFGGVSVSGGGAHITVRTLGALSTPALSISGGSGTTTVQAFEIISSTYIAIRYSAASQTAKLNIIGARIVSNGSTSTGRAIDVIETTADYNIRLTGCVLLASGDFSIGVSSGKTAKIQLNGGSVAKKGNGGGGTLLLLPTTNWFADNAIT